MSQKIRSDAFTSFSVLGLGILLGIGGLIIITSYTLEFFVEWIQERANLSNYSRLEWTTNGTLQLQRLAHEELGFGTWTRTAEDCPVTKPGEQLAVLDISDPKHPRLKCTSTNLEHLEEGQLPQEGNGGGDSNTLATSEGSDQGGLTQQGNDGGDSPTSVLLEVRDQGGLLEQGNDGRESEV